MSKSDRDIPIAGEVNPNHPMTRFARDQWHKIAALLMQEIGRDTVEITEEMISRLANSQKAIVIQEKAQRLFIHLMSREEAQQLARKEGGLPI